MSRLTVILLVFVASAIVGWIGFTALNTSYLKPRRELKETIAAAKDEIAASDQARRDAPRIAGKLHAIVDRTLGPDLESVDHHLRRRLNRVGEVVRLAALSVQTGDEKARGTPAERDFPSRWKNLREELDFIELNGFISGEGSYAQALELIARLEAEPWIKRIYHVRLDPMRGADHFRINVRLTTLFLPGQSPRQPLPEDPPAIDQARVAQLAASNPFVIPEKPAAPPTPDVQVAKAPSAPPFPYEQWVMTGVVSGPSGAEVWLLESGSGTTKLLAPGESLRDLKLVAAQGDQATFEWAGRNVQLSVGQNLGEIVKH